MGNLKFWSENLKVRDNLGDLDVDKRIILKWILNRMCGCKVNSAVRERDQRRAPVDTIMNFLVP
jgi:hypothetical protein